MKNKILILIVLLLISGVAYGAYTIYQILNPETLFEPKKPQTKEKEAEKYPIEDKEVSAPAEQLEEEYRFDENRVNLLLLGLDASEERYETMKAFRTDTIVFLSIDFQNNQVYLISIPRDSYVRIPGRKQRDRINTAFVWGGGFNGNGFERTIETVSNFLGGVPIHYYAAVDMNVFKEIIDVMGGVEFDVDVPVKMGGRELKPGLQRLSGQQVLDYCRNRHSPGGDIDRIQRQQKMILAIFDQLKSSNQLLNISKYYQAVTGKIYTNLNIKQITALGVFGMRLAFSDIHTYSIPGDFLNINGVSYWGIDQYKKKELVKEIFGVEIKIDPQDDVKYIKKELEEKRKALEAAVNQANAIIQSAKEAMSTYAAYIKQDEKAGIQLRIDKVQRGIEDEDIEAVNQAARELKDYINKLVETCAQRKKEYEERKAHEQALNDARKNAEQVMQWVTAQINEKGDNLSQENRQKLDALIAVVKNALAGQNAQDIVNKTAQLKNEAEAIFKAIDESGQGQQPQEDNQEEPNAHPQDG